MGVEFEVGYNEIVKGLRKLGLTNGDKLLVHSSLSSFGNVEGGELTVIDALLSVVGNNGIVAMPTHTWDTVNAKQPVFHAGLSRSIVGKISETFRNKTGVIRSRHPTHSVAVFGDNASRFVEGHENWSTPCSENSPYGKLVQEGGYVLLLGVDLSVCTLFHGFEEWAGCPWLFNRTEILYTVLNDGTIMKIPSRRHTDEKGYDRDYPAFEPLLLKRGIIRSVSIGNATVKLLDAKASSDLLVPLFKSHHDAPLSRRAEVSTLSMKNSE
jgi:aminoglycoside 3-N-acetyltransferase